MTGNVPDGRHCPGQGSEKTFEDLRDKYGMILKGNDEIMLVIHGYPLSHFRDFISHVWSSLSDWSWFQGEALMRKARGQDAWRSVVESVGISWVFFRGAALQHGIFGTIWKVDVPNNIPSGELT